MGYVRRIFLGLIAAFFICPVSFAISIDEGMDFFNSFVKAASSYDTNLLNFYEDNASIKRIIIKGPESFETKVISASAYKMKLKYYSKMAAVTKYKNLYTNLQFIPYGNDIKIKGYRKPSTSNEKFEVEVVVGKNQNGKMVIKQDITHTKAAFLL